jgi:hypothetical protein
MRLDNTDLEAIVDAIRPVVRQEVDAAIQAQIGDIKPKPWFTRRELAEHLHVGEYVIRDADQRGELPSIRVGRQSRYNVGDCEAALKFGNGRAGPRA